MMPRMGPEGYRYSAHHLWVSRIGRIARVGITDFAQRELGEVLFVELPEVDDELERNETFGEIESGRTTSELVMPVSGTVVAVNEDLDEAPGAVNEDPYGRGWLVEVELADPSELEELLDADAYARLVDAEADPDDASARPQGENGNADDR
ncbi:MAG TPA: glycine cleavage system protein GcvH [Thermodesulfobacteriota bacterium]